MYAGRVAWCPLVSHVEYVTRALSRLEKDAACSINVRKKNGTDGLYCNSVKFVTNPAVMWQDAINHSLIV